MYTNMLFLALGVGLLFAAPAFAEHESYVKVEVKGVLHNVEDSRLFVEAGGQRYRLDIGDSHNLRGFVARHNRAPVIVFGMLYVDRNADGNVVNLEVVTHQIRTVPSPAYQGESAEREAVVIQEEPVRERIVVVEEPVREVIVEERREPLIKLGPLEIGR